MSIRVLVADDQQMVRAGFRLILSSEPDLQVIGEAGDGAQAVALTRRLQPDVVLMDIRMPALDGLEATRQIVQPGQDMPKVIILTTFDTDEYVYSALRAGASGFLLKNSPPEQLVEAIRVVAAGDALLSPSVTRQLITEFVRHPPRKPDPSPRLGPLTDRERAVLIEIARGLSNAEIAARLFVSEATVKTHVSRLLAKLELRDRIQAVIYAFEHDLLPPSS